MSDKKQEAAPVKQTEQQSHDAELVKATVKSVTEEMMAMFLALQSAQGSKTEAKEMSLHTKLAVEQELHFARAQKCQTCGQKLSGCNNEHELIAVYPTRFPQYADYFQGVFINGVRYLSNNLDHRIPVPKACVGDIAHKVRVAEEEEIVARNGRVKQNNSGDVSRPKAFNPAADGFR